MPFGAQIRGCGPRSCDAPPPAFSTDWSLVSRCGLIGHGVREVSVRAQRAAGTALILAKHRVVDEAFRETDIRLVSISALGRCVITPVYREGWVAGERVNLIRPMAVSGQSLLG
jgi:hypothetical protein